MLSILSILSSIIDSHKHSFTTKLEVLVPGYAYHLKLIDDHASGLYSIPKMNMTINREMAVGHVSQNLLVVAHRLINDYWLLTIGIYMYLLTESFQQLCATISSYFAWRSLLVLYKTTDNNFPTASNCWSLLKLSMLKSARQGTASQGQDKSDHKGPKTNQGHLSKKEQPALLSAALWGLVG